MLPEETQVEDSYQFIAANASTLSEFSFGIGCPFFWVWAPAPQNVCARACVYIWVYKYI